LYVVIVNPQLVLTRELSQILRKVTDFRTSRKEREPMVTLETMWII
jgi:hypothetical protein